MISSGFYNIFNDALSWSHFDHSEIAAFFSAEGRQDLQEKRDSVPTPLLLASNSEHPVLGDPLSSIISYLDKPLDVLSLLSTCKRLNKDRIVRLVDLAPTLSFLFNKALTKDYLSECTDSFSLLSISKHAMNFLTLKRGESEVGKILNLFTKPSYPTKLSLQTPGGRGSDRIVTLIKEILKKFPYTSEIRFTKHDNLTNTQFKDIMTLCPRLEHLTGQFPNQDSDNWNISFPETLKICNLLSTGSRNSIDRETVRKLLSSKVLQKLYLNSWKKNSPYDFVGVAFSENLIELYLFDSNINDLDLREINKTCTSLQVLDISWNKFITPRGFIEFPFPKTLLFLSVAHTQFDGRGLVAVCMSCQELQYLNMSCCSMLTSRDICNSAFPETLDTCLLDEVNILPFGVKWIVSRCPRIKILDTTLFLSLPTSVKQNER
jgi:hypothetical protein